MEEKLLRMMENCKAMQTDNKDLKEHLSSTTSINTAEIKGTCIHLPDDDPLISAIIIIIMWLYCSCIITVVALCKYIIAHVQCHIIVRDKKMQKMEELIGVLRYWYR